MKKIFLLSFLVLLSSCSRSSFLVEIFDAITASRVDEYFDLSSAQKTELKKNLRQDADAVRRELLPEISGELQKTAKLVDEETLSPQVAAEKYHLIQGYFKKIAQAFKGSALKMTADLKPEQLKYFEKQVKKDIDKLKEQNEDTKKSQKTAFEKYKRSLKFWVGSMSDDQEKKIYQFLEQNPYPWQLEVQNKEYVLAQFLKSYESPEKQKIYVESYFNDFENARLPEYTTALNAHKKSFQEFFAKEFWPTLSQKQKVSLRENLIERAEQIQKISLR